MQRLFISVSLNSCHEFKTVMMKFRVVSKKKFASISSYWDAVFKNSLLLAIEYSNVFYIKFGLSPEMLSKFGNGFLKYIKKTSNSTWRTKKWILWGNVLAHTEKPFNGKVSLLSNGDIQSIHHHHHHQNLKIILSQWCIFQSCLFKSAPWSTDMTRHRLFSSCSCLFGLCSCA